MTPGSLLGLTARSTTWAAARSPIVAAGSRGLAATGSSSSSSSSRTYDVAVVGGGIMGASTAASLAQRGLSVVLLEQFDFLHVRGSSHGDSRITRKSYPQAYYTAMMRDAYRLWEEAQAESGMSVYRRTGGIDFGEAGSPGVSGVVESMEANGEAYEVLGPREVRERFPMWALPDEYEAVFSEQSGVLHATDGVDMMLRLARARGADLRAGQRVSSIALVPGGVEVTAGGGGGQPREVVSAGRCVVAAGAWAGRVLAEGIDGAELEGPPARPPPLKPIHTTVGYYRCEPGMLPHFEAGRCPVFIFRNAHRGDELYGMPVEGMSGVIKIGRHAGPDCDPDQRDPGPYLPDLEGSVVPFISKYMTGVQAPAHIDAHGCMYTMTPDEDFILDTLPGCGGRIAVGAGFSGHGYKLGPLVGRILADLATGEDPGVDMAPFRLARFQQGPKLN